MTIKTKQSQFQDDFQRDINIVIPQKDGNENRTRVHVATFDTRADWNFIDEHLVRDCDRAPSCSGDTQRDPPLPLISSIGGREIQVCGRITLRFQVLDKPCLHKKIFAQPRFIKADFLIVRPQAARCDFEALISLKTFQEEGLDRQTARRFLRQGGRRELHPEMAEGMNFILRCGITRTVLTSLKNRIDTWLARDRWSQK